MPLSHAQITRFLKSLHPYDALPTEVIEDLAPLFEVVDIAQGTAIYDVGTPLAGLYLIHSGQVEVSDDIGVVVSHLGERNSFGERGLLRDGIAVTSARAESDATLLILPPAALHKLIDAHQPVAKFFDRSRPATPQEHSLATSRVETIMARDPITCSQDDTVQQAASLMRDHRISSLCIIEDEQLTGILTTRDLTSKVLALALPTTTLVRDVMTANPLTLPPTAIGSDVLHTMMEHRIGHIPIIDHTRLVGVVTQTDLTRYQAISSAELVSEIAQATSAEDIAAVTARIPKLLMQLVAGGNRHEVVTRLITDIADTATRRLLTLAEEKLGPPPAPYLWLACGSQGRQEQTGVSDQDNCLILDDSVTDADREGYFAQLAQIVSDGLHICGYVYCPGDMMATNPRWCQPLSVWKGYFTGWINKPDPEAQMLASVMFDLRPIGGDFGLFDDLQQETLKAAASNSIFVAHMIGNSLKHTPPLGLLRGLATIRHGEHKNTLDLKHNGVVPVTDLARIYALQGNIMAVNTRARLEAAEQAGVLSKSGGQDLLSAYDLIADTRLEHQAQRVKTGSAPDNFLAPADLSDFDRSHLRDAFVVVKTMQSAVSHGRGVSG